MASLKPDAIIIATGSVPLRLPIPGLDSCGCSTAEDVLTGKADTGKRVLVVGGGMVGCECVEFLTEREHIVDMVEMKPVIGEDIVPEARKYIMANLAKHKVTQRVNARVKQFYADGVDFTDTVTGEDAAMRGYDSVVLAMGYRSNNTLEEQLKVLAPQVIVIGEARQAPGNSMEATGDALNAALAI
ncbi:MAG: FAD-dependent oxidoreductase [Lachnospiraceae bacterium]